MTSAIARNLPGRTVQVNLAAAALVAFAAACGSTESKQSTAAALPGPNLDPRVPRAPAAVSTEDPGTLGYDRDVWQTLLYHHSKIRREVKRLPNGLAAVTESDDPAVAMLIKDHALAMKDRIGKGRRVRTWDPVFRELFDRHDKVRLEVELTAKGVSIVETTDDPETLRLLRSHSAGVTEMVIEGNKASQRETPFVND
jgi:hypothetical protein